MARLYGTVIVRDIVPQHQFHRVEFGIVRHFRVVHIRRERLRITFTEPSLRQRVRVGDGLGGSMPLFQGSEVQEAIGHEGADGGVVGVGEGLRRFRQAFRSSLL